MMVLIINKRVVESVVSADDSHKHNKKIIEINFSNSDTQY